MTTLKLLKHDVKSRNGYANGTHQTIHHSERHHGTLAHLRIVTVLVAGLAGKLAYVSINSVGTCPLNVIGGGELLRHPAYLLYARYNGPKGYGRGEET